MGKVAALADNIDTLLAAVPCGLLIVNRQGDLVFANDAFADLFFLPRSLTRSGAALLDIHRHILGCRAHAPEDVETEAEAITNRVLRDTGSGSDAIEQLCLKNGRMIEIRRKRLDDGSIVLSYSGTVSPTESAGGFIGSEQTLRAVVEDQTEMICRFDREFRLTFVNRAYCEAFGKSEQDLIGSVFLDLIVDENARRDLAAGLLELSPHTPVLYGDYPERSPDGTIVWQSWANRALFDEDGELREFQAVGRDITAERGMIEALEASEARLRDIADANPVPLLIFDLAAGMSKQGGGMTCTDHCRRVVQFRRSGENPPGDRSGRTFGSFRTGSLSTRR